MWDLVPEDIRVGIKQENGYRTRLGNFQYTVRANQDGDFIVFRSIGTGHNTRNKPRQQHSYNVDSIYRICEVQVLQLKEANALLKTDTEFQLIGEDPVKIVSGKFFLALGRKEKVADGKYLGEEKNDQCS
jgi:hypothetical protein